MSDPIREAIVATLSAVPDVGIVHPYQRYADDRAALARLYMQDGLLLGWYVRKAAVQRLQEGAKWYRAIKWQIVGFRGWSDADQTDLLFDTLLEAIVAAFEQDISLGVPNLTTLWREEAGLQLEEIAPAMFGGVLCHRAVGYLWTVQMKNRDKNKLLQPLGNNS